jgi:hypothetical protein
MQAPLTNRAIEYAWRELTRRAGVVGDDDESGLGALGVLFHYGQPGEIRGDAPSVVVIPSDPADWRRLLELPDGQLETVPLEDALPPGASPLPYGPLPVLFRGRGPRVGGGFARRVGRTAVFDCDLVASTLFLLSRWEETVIPIRDEHGRVPYTESVAHRQGFLGRPLVDEYALVLREWLKVLLPEWVPVAGRFSVKLSHDVDTVRPFTSLRNGARLAAGDLLRRHNPALAAKTARLALLQGVVPRQTSFYKGIFRLAEISRRCGMASAFYFMAADPSAYDSGYDPRSRPVREAIRRLQDLGFEIGFHPGYETLGNPERLAKEKSRLDAVLGGLRYGGRQHYLRFGVPDTWRQWERLGLAYDSTMTFAGHEGFRCGTCHPYRPFDIETNRVLDIQELPLIVMDGTLRQYRGLTPAEAECRVLELARRCRAVEGTFTLLWHNSSLAGEWADWGSRYEAMVRALSELKSRCDSPARPAAASSRCGPIGAEISL